MAYVCVCIGGQVPEVVVCFVDPVARVLLCAGPAVAKVCEPGHERVDDVVCAVGSGVGLRGWLGGYDDDDDWGYVSMTGD